MTISWKNTSKNKGLQPRLRNPFLLVSQSDLPHWSEWSLSRNDLENWLIILIKLAVNEKQRMPDILRSLLKAILDKLIMEIPQLLLSEDQRDYFQFRTDNRCYLVMKCNELYEIEKGILDAINTVDTLSRSTVYVWSITSYSTSVLMSAN